MAAKNLTASKGPAARMYERMTAARDPYLGRARRLARLTLTSLFTEEGSTGSTDQEVPWQSFGAYAANTLSAKIVLGQFPPGIPYIKVKATKEVLASLTDLPDDKRGLLRQEIEKGLAAVEAEFAECCEEDGDRMVDFDTARHLVVGGNHALHIMPDDRLRGIPLENYVVKRDNAGTVLRACIQDQLDWDSLEEDVQALAIENGYEVEYEGEGNGAPKDEQAPVNVYTSIRRTREGKYEVCQEAWGCEVPGSKATYSPEDLPYVFLRMVSLKKESYGRSYCEDYEGDLQALDGLAQITMEGSAAVAQLKWMVKPGGVTNKKTFAELQNGGVMTGDPEDVGAVRSEHQSELQVAESKADKIEARLSRVFLLYSSIQRQGERVTREEIITLRQDLDAGLGGVYSNQSVEWAAPKARLKMASLQRHKRVTKLPKGSTRTVILTGDAALGRQMDAERVDKVMASLVQFFGPQALAQYSNVAAYAQRKATAEHVDMDGIFKSPEQVAQEQAQAAQQQLAMQVAPHVVDQVGQTVQNEQQATLAAAPPAPQGA